MKYIQLHKQTDKQTLTICGHMNKDEVKEYKREGWKMDREVNKHGIVRR